MSDEPTNTPPPMDDDNNQNPVDSAADAVENAAESIADAIPAAAPGTVGLAQGKLGEKDEKTMGMLAHILGAFFCFVGPLIIWLIKKDESPFVDDQGKEALNFQITMAIAFVVVGVVANIPVIGFVACIAWPAVGIADLVLSIMGGLAANKGIAHRYPFALRLIS